MKDTRIDKTILTAQSFEDTDKSNLFDKDVSLADRLKMAFRLTCKIYGMGEGQVLKLDRTVFSARKF